MLKGENKKKMENWLQKERENLIEEMSPISVDFCNDHDASFLGDIVDDCHDYADGFVDVYSGTLLNWLAEDWRNVEAVEDAANEFGTGERLDLMQLIRQGQYYQYDEQLREDRARILRVLAIDYILSSKKLEKLEIDKIKTALDDAEDCDTGDEITAIVDELGAQA